MRWLRMLFAAVLALSAGAPRDAAAALLGDASVPYSAERTVTVNGRAYSGKVFHTPGHQRHEQTIQGFAQVVLLDASAKRGWLVLPDLKTYVEFAFPKLMADLGDPALRRAPVGRETVNGVPTTKYRIDHTAADGTHGEGFLWISAQGIMMRLDGTVARPGATRPTTIRMELSHLVMGPQDPTLFELPQGLVKLPAAALEPLLGGKPG